MSLFRAVLWIDHHEARLVQFDAEHTISDRIREHSRHTKQHGSAVRSEHEFYAEVCDAIKGVSAVLVAGSHQNQADFRHYLQKHRPAQEAQVIGYETVDHLSEAQLLAMARKVFVRHDAMGGTPSTS